jgi:hypothetical protein
MGLTCRDGGIPKNGLECPEGRVFTEPCLLSDELA